MTFRQDFINSSSSLAPRRSSLGWHCGEMEWSDHSSSEASGVTSKSLLSYVVYGRMACRCQCTTVWFADSTCIREKEYWLFLSVWC